jgi:hypothetical protein
MADGIVVDADHVRLAPEGALEYLLQSLQDEGMRQHVRFEVTNLVTGATYIVIDGAIEEVVS